MSTVGFQIFEDASELIVDETSQESDDVILSDNSGDQTTQSTPRHAVYSHNLEVVPSSMKASLKAKSASSSYSLRRFSEQVSEASERIAQFQSNNPSDLCALVQVHTEPVLKEADPAATVLADSIPSVNEAASIANRNQVRSCSVAEPPAVKAFRIPYTLNLSTPRYISQNVGDYGVSSQETAAMLYLDNQMQIDSHTQSYEG